MSKQIAVHSDKKLFSAKMSLFFYAQNACNVAEINFSKYRISLKIIRGLFSFFWDFIGQTLIQKVALKHRNILKLVGYPKTIVNFLS